MHQNVVRRIMRSAQYFAICDKMIGNFISNQRSKNTNLIVNIWLYACRMAIDPLLLT